jgi:WXG100 family type VII secretion target
MHTIRLTPADIRRRAENIEQNAATVRREVENIQALLDGLRPTFLGNKSSKFFKAFDRERTAMSQWDDIVRSFADELRAVATRMERADNS